MPRLQKLDINSLFYGQWGELDHCQYQASVALQLSLTWFVFVYLPLSLTPIFTTSSWYSTIYGTHSSGEDNLGCWPNLCCQLMLSLYRLWLDSCIQQCKSHYKKWTGSISVDGLTLCWWEASVIRNDLVSFEKGGKFIPRNKGIITVIGGDQQRSKILSNWLAEQ
jgi:hypothetical protein